MSPDFVPQVPATVHVAFAQHDNKDIPCYVKNNNDRFFHTAVLSCQNLQLMVSIHQAILTPARGFLDFYIRLQRFLQIISANEDVDLQTPEHMQEYQCCIYNSKMGKNRSLYFRLAVVPVPI